LVSLFDAPDGRTAVGWRDDLKAFRVRLAEPTGWGADEVVESAFGTYQPALIAGPDGLWGRVGTDGGCDAARRTDLGWEEVGLANSIYSDFFQLHERPVRDEADLRAAGCPGTQPRPLGSRPSGGRSRPGGLEVASAESRRLGPRPCGLDPHTW
jgi:hypothetical protein